MYDSIGLLAEAVAEDAVDGVQFDSVGAVGCEMTVSSMLAGVEVGDRELETLCLSFVVAQVVSRSHEVDVGQLAVLARAFPVLELVDACLLGGGSAPQRLGGIRERREVG